MAVACGGERVPAPADVEGGARIEPAAVTAVPSEKEPSPSAIPTIGPDPGLGLPRIDPCNEGPFVKLEVTGAWVFDPANRAEGSYGTRPRGTFRILLRADLQSDGDWDLFVREAEPGERDASSPFGGEPERRGALHVFVQCSADEYKLVLRTRSLVQDVELDTHPEHAGAILFFDVIALVGKKRERYRLQASGKYELLTPGSMGSPD